METTILKVNISELTPQFIEDLKGDLGQDAQVEIRVQESKHGQGLFSEDGFWKIIDLLDWSQRDRAAVIAPAAKALSKMHLPAIFLFQDILSEKLFSLDTRQHAEAYKQKQADGSFSADDFLYTRCAVIAEGKDYYEKILKNPVEMPTDIDFEHLLGLADEAFKIKTGKELDYLPLFNYETHSNEAGWK